MTDCNTPVYIVYVMATEKGNGGIFHTTHDINEARTIAQEQAMADPGREIYIATRTNIFVAETTVRER